MATAGGAKTQFNNQSIAGNKIYGNLTHDNGILTSEKRIRQDGQIVNLIMVDTHGLSIAEYAYKHFDLEICATCTNGTEIWIPNANDFVHRQTRAKADTKVERIAKYQARGIKVLVPKLVKIL